MSQSEDILRATSDVLLEMGRNTLAKVLRQLAEVGSCTISLGPKDLGYFVPIADDWLQHMTVMDIEQEDPNGVGVVK